MNKYTEITFLGIEENKTYAKLIEKVAAEAFEEEKLTPKMFYLNIILTDPAHIQKINCQYRNMDRETDVLSFPMFEKEEIEEAKKGNGGGQEVLGDIIISIPRVKEQANEYGHSFERELSYMVIHGFYHLMGYDHIQEEEKKQMRNKEETVLKKLNIVRE